MSDSDDLLNFDTGMTRKKSSTSRSSSSRASEKRRRATKSRRLSSESEERRNREFDQLINQALGRTDDLSPTRRSSSIRRSHELRANEETLTEQEKTRLASPSMTYLVKRWGYDAGGHTHSKFEAETHEANWGRMLQYYTDFIFRSLAKIQQERASRITTYDMNHTFDKRGSIEPQYRGAVQKLLKRFVNKTTRKQLRALETLCKRSNTTNLQVMGRAVDLLLQMADGHFE